MEAHDRALVAMKLAGLAPRDEETEQALLDLLGDASHYVRERAWQALSQSTVSPAHVPRLEALLTRQASDLRRGVLAMLAKQKDQDALASAERLLASSNVRQRLAGLEMLGQLVHAGRCADQCRARVNAYRTQARHLTDAEARLIGLLFDELPINATLEDALGLMNPAERTKPVPPRPPSELKIVAPMSSLVTPATFALLHAFDAFIDEHRTLPVMIGTQEQLLGNLRWGFGEPHRRMMHDPNASTFPLRELWESWWHARPAAQRDADGPELVRAWVLGTAEYYAFVPQYDAQWLKPILETLLGKRESRTFKYPAILRAVIAWLVFLHPPQGAVDFLLDATELTFALIPPNELQRPPLLNTYPDHTWRSHHRLLACFTCACLYRAWHPAEWSQAQRVRLWHLLRWYDEPLSNERARRDQALPKMPRHRPDLDEVIAAYRAGAATQADLLDHLLGSRDAPRWGIGFESLRILSGRNPHPLFDDIPLLRDLVNRCRERIIEIETKRGELPTAASAPALALRSVIGADKLIRLLRALGSSNLVRGYTFDSLSKSSVLSHLIRITFPGESDSFESFAHALREANIPPARLLEVAVYAPQWTEFIEHTLNWDGLAEAVWWLHAHTKDAYWHVDQEIREIWQAQATERTPLAGEDLIDGAVDVEWFKRVYQSLGEERWNALYQAAKAGAGGKGHLRARLFADAMLGRVDKATLLANIARKRHQDSVRALGLVPLTDERDVLERYQVIQEFLRTSKKFGALRQQSEKRAAMIALENLARTAGYADPIRLEWAMETCAVADWVNGAKTITRGDVTITLAIDQWGDANVHVMKKDKPLKAIPAKLKDPQVSELINRKKEIERQMARMRASLEQAMCRGDVFTAAELQLFFAHSLLKPMIEPLVFVVDGAMGYPIENGRALRAYDGTRIPLRAETQLRLAHPYDLLLSQVWHLWQRECFIAERVQPFKQIFRELYVLTLAEIVEHTVSRRNAGHQVQTKQALALLGQRGWVNHPSEGGVRRVFHAEKLAAWVILDQGWTTPAEVEGARIEEVYFTRRGDWKPLPLTDIPPRVFSEAMRDLDLVVSVAHAGGVDPEASASTIEMRAALVSETCALLKLDNVRLQSPHVLIEGELGNYSVHLGSAIVHSQPGRMVCIVPVPAQHRGRLFLPFADDDPKTAEVLSKVLLLARDTEIRDPVILQQLQA